jgi:hypothetical protein
METEMELDAALLDRTRDMLADLPYKQLPLPDEPMSREGALEVLERVLEYARDVVATRGVHPPIALVFSEHDHDGKPMGGFCLHAMACSGEWQGAPEVPSQVAHVFSERVIDFGKRTQGFGFVIVVQMPPCDCGCKADSPVVVVKLGHIALGQLSEIRVAKVLGREAPDGPVRIGPWTNPHAN